MELLIGLGLTKHIGVANASIPQLDQILAAATIKPATNHIECCPGLHQKKTIKFCKENEILVTAYCPLGRPDFRRLSERYNNDSGVLEICQRHGKTSSQLILRYLVSSTLNCKGLLIFTKVFHFYFSINWERFQCPRP